MSATGPMESPPQGEVMEAPSALPSATNAGGGSRSDCGAGGFDCSLGLDEQVQNIKHCFNGLNIDICEDDIVCGEAALERLRTDPLTDVQILVLEWNGQNKIWGGATALHVAVMAGDVKMVEKILESNSIIDINGYMCSRDNRYMVSRYYEYTALHAAVASGNVNIVDVLVGKGADLMLVNNENGTILHAAVKGGHEHVVKQILDHYLYFLIEDDYKMTPLHWAAKQSAKKEMVGVVKSLCQCQNMDVKALDKNGCTAFYYAVHGGNIEVVKELLKILELVFVQHIDGCTSSDELKYIVLHLAVASGNVNIVDVLVGIGVDLMLVDNEKGIILHAAVKGGHEHVVKQILGQYLLLANARDDDQMIPLHWLAKQSAKKEMVDIVKNLCQCCLCQCLHVDVKALDKNGCFAFYYAVHGGNIEVVKELLKILEPDFVQHIDGCMSLDELKYIVLHLAVASGNVNIVDVLVGKGVDLMLVDNGKGTILHAAVKGGHEHVVK